MRKLCISIMALVLMLSLSTPVLATETSSGLHSTSSFEFTLEEVLSKVDPSLIKVSDGATTIPVHVEINDKLYTEMLITVSDTTRSNAKSFSMEGWFRLTASKQIVTVYGLDGTFEYNGVEATSTGRSAYHNSCLSGWTGSYNTNTTQGDDGSFTISANFTVYQNGEVNNTASCSAKCTKSGTITFSGNYDESNIL